jgi:hypothetical protein
VYTRVRTARADEYEHLILLYITWGYRGGIDSADVVYVAEHAERVVDLVRHCIDHEVTVLRGMHVDSTCQYSRIS